MSDLPAPYFPEELDRRPLQLDDEQRRFLVEYVESGGELKGSVIAVRGSYTSDNMKWGTRTLRMPDARWFMHRYRVHEDRRVLRSPLDLAVVLEDIALSTRTAMKYRVRALDMITRLMIAHHAAQPAVVSEQHRMLTEEQLADWRRRVIGIDVEVRERDQQYEDAVAAVTPEPPDADANSE